LNEKPFVLKPQVVEKTLQAQNLHIGAEKLLCQALFLIVIRIFKYDWKFAFVFLNISQ
jgi:hypothetical protein